MDTKNIDSILLKAQCIKKIDGDKGIGNIDGLIESLKSYKENIGDISFLKTYRFTYIYRRRDCEDKLLPIKIKLHGLTENIIGNLEHILLKGCPKGLYNSSNRKCIELVNCVPDTDDVIYDYIFDVESYPVSHDLEVELYRNGFNSKVRYIPAGITMEENGKFIDNIEECSFYRVAVGRTICGSIIYEDVKRCGEFYIDK